jgi:magnesium chelatase family protein
LLAADQQLVASALEERSFLGELGLDGTLRPVPGALPLIDALDTPEIVIPPACVTEARLVKRHRIRAAGRLSELVPALRGEVDWPELPDSTDPGYGWSGPDLADVRGQPAARSALEIAAAGGHHLLLVGPPGAGKSMLARRLPGLLPELPRPAALEATRIHSAAGLPLPPGGLIRRPPFRSPHHGASAASLVGGGAYSIQPGEISLAHASDE